MLPFGQLKPTTKLTFGKVSGRRPGLEPKDKAPATKLTNPPDTPGLINGQTPGSSYEWNVARALWTLGWTFDYQVGVGMADVAGSQRLDFLVHTVPVYTALLVNGDFWHSQPEEEELKKTDMLAGLKAEGYPVGPEALTLWNADACTYEAALNFLTAHLGRG